LVLHLAMNWVYLMEKNLACYLCLDFLKEIERVIQKEIHLGIHLEIHLVIHLGCYLVQQKAINLVPRLVRCSESHWVIQLVSH